MTSGKRRPRSKSRASAVTAVTGRPAPRSAQRGEQLGVAVERDDLVAAAREVERDAAGAGADVEHGRALAVGELAPQRQVEVVGAALDVVPDDVVGAH